MKIINAVDAKKETEKNIAHHMVREIDDINAFIKKAISQGLFHICVKGPLQKSTIGQLKRVAYSVAYNQMDDDYTISWSDIPAERYIEIEKETMGSFPVKGIKL